MKIAFFAPGIPKVGKSMIYNVIKKKGGRDEKDNKDL